MTTVAKKTSTRNVRRLAAGVVLATATLWSLVAPAPSSADEAADFALAKEYAETFYPLWLSVAQTTIDPANKLIGPDKITHVYRGVVAINDDTLYASSPIDSSGGPVLVSVPETTVAYSVLNLDLFGNVYDLGIPSQPNGTVYPATTYALLPPGYAGVVPPGTTPVTMADDFMTLIFRSDKYRPDGTDVTAESEAFRRALAINGTPTDIIREADYGFSFKLAADELMRLAPIDFLTELQAAVGSANVPTLSPAEQALSDAFDAAFPPAGSDIGFREGTRAAHRAIVDNYLGAAGPTGWNHFTNIGAWGDAVLDRASLNMYIQYGNSIATAAYYHAFVDGDGNALTGATSDGYVFRMGPDEIPDAGRFWSLTGYTPDTVELIENDLGKYEVASYTPGLVMDADGGVTIYIGQTLPDGVPEANWLPVRDQDFNVMLRVYGVVAGSSVALNTYVPPAVVPYVPTPSTTTTTVATSTTTATTGGIAATPVSATPRLTG